MGDPGDKMYFSIRGRLGIYLSKEVHGDPVAIIPEYSTVGDRALKHEEDRRSATVICLDLGTTHCLSLSKENYQKLVFVGINYFFIFIFYFISFRDHILLQKDSDLHFWSKILNRYFPTGLKLKF